MGSPEGAVNDLPDAVVFLYRDTVVLAAEVGVDLVLHHEFPKRGLGAVFEHAGAGVLAFYRPDDGEVTLHDHELGVFMIDERLLHPGQLLWSDGISEPLSGILEGIEGDDE